MASGNTEYRTEITADTSDYEAAWRRVEAATRTGSDRVIASVSKIGEATASLHGRLVGFAAVLSVGAFAQSVRVQLEMADAMSKAAQSAGVSTTAFSELAYAGSLADVQSEMLGKSLGKLSSELVKAAAGDAPLRQLFEQTLGVKVRDAAGQVRAADIVLEDLADRFSDMEDGAKKTALAARLFGEELGPKLVPFLNQGRQGISAAREEARKLGLSISDEVAAKAETFNDNMTRMAKATEGAKLAIGTELLPQMVRLSELFVQAAGDVGVAQAALITFGAAVARVLGVDEQGKAESRYRSLNAEVERLNLVLLGVKNNLAADPDNSAVQRRVATLTSKIEALKREAIEAGAEVARVAAGNPNAGGGRGFVNPRLVTGPKPFDPDVKGIAPPAAPAPSRMGEWEAALAQRKAELQRTAMLEGQYREMGKAEELRYWSGLLAQKGLSEEEKRALTRKTAEVEMASIKDTFEGRVRALQAEGEQYRFNFEERLRIEREIQAKYQEGTKEYAAAEQRITELKRQAAEQQATIAQSRADAERDARLQTIALEEQALQTAVALGIVQQSDALAREADFEMRRNEILRQALEERGRMMALLDPNNPVEVERLHRELEQREQQHQLRMGQIRGQQAVDSAKDFNAAKSSIESGWANLLQQLAMGSITIGGFIRGVFQTVLQAVISTLANMVAQWLVNQLMMLIFGKTTAASQIAANAGVAGSAAVASAAAIPVYGWSIAPQAGMAAFAAAMAYQGTLMSAAGGYDIPGTLNPIVQAHAREMILPAKHADVIRRMADEPESRAPVQPQPPVVLRGVSAGEFFIASRHDLARAIQRLDRDNALRSSR